MSIERPSANDNHNKLTVTQGNNHQRRLTPSDYTTEVTFCNSKSDNWAMNVNDETMQTERSSICTQQLLSGKDDETTDLLSIANQRLSANHLQQTQVKPAAPSLIISNENPWKKLGNVKYKLDGDDVNQNNSSRYHPGYAQHITFV
jgi:hypothetical protein